MFCSAKGLNCHSTQCELLKQEGLNIQARMMIIIFTCTPAHQRGHGGRYRARHPAGGCRE